MPHAEQQTPPDGSLVLPPIHSLEEAVQELYEMLVRHARSNAQHTTVWESRMRAFTLQETADLLREYVNAVPDGPRLPERPHAFSGFPAGDPTPPATSDSQ